MSHEHHRATFFARSRVLAWRSEPQWLPQDDDDDDGGGGRIYSEAGRPFRRSTHLSTTMTTSAITAGTLSDIEDGPPKTGSGLVGKGFAATVVHHRKAHVPTLTNEFQALSLRRRDLLLESLEGSTLFTHGLASLDLSRNRLDDLPRSLGCVSATLEHLNISGNQFKKLPEVILSLNSLRTLDISNNKISGQLDGRLCQSTPCLRQFACYGNEITGLPADVSEWRWLTRLRCGSSMHGGNGIQSIPAATISKLPNLEELDFTMNQLTNLPKDLGFRGSRLQHLSLGSNRLESLPKSVGLCEELRCVNLESNMLCKIPAELGYLKKLQVLNLSNNSLCAVPSEVVESLGTSDDMQVFLSGNPFSNPESRPPPRSGTTGHDHAGGTLTFRNTSSLPNGIATRGCIRHLPKLTLRGVHKRHRTKFSRIDEGFLGNAATEPTPSAFAIPEKVIQRGRILTNVVGGSVPGHQIPVPQSGHREMSPSCAMLPTLVELAARSLIEHKPHLLSKLPPTALRYVLQGAPCSQDSEKSGFRRGHRSFRACQWCRHAFLQQYITTTELVGVKGHVNVPVVRNYCSSACLDCRVREIEHAGWADRIVDCSICS